MRTNQAARAVQRAAAHYRPLTRIAATASSLRSSARGLQSTVAAGRRFTGGAVVDHFETEDGPPLPIFDTYRYATKFDPGFYPGAGELATLSARGVLTAAEEQTARRSLGTRTLGVDLDEIRAVLGEVASRHPDQFIDAAATDVRVKPDPARVEAQIDRLLLLRYRQLQQLGFDLRGGRRLRVLEIGFTSGGHSLVALERLGFEVTGIDNFYDGTMTASAVPEHIVHGLSGSRARLVVGDAADPTVLAGEQFDLIFSESVVEHLARPQETFATLGRLLGPGGVMVHTYEPYFCERGGHTPGTLDCPFGHLRLSPADHLRYIDEKRPHESAVAGPWVAHALNRATQADVQRAVLGAGFEITGWITHSGASNTLDPTELATVLERHPTITTRDLASTGVWFSCRPST